MKLGLSPLIAGAMAAIALWLLNSAPAAGQAPGRAGATKQPMSEQAFKNVTVLKGIPVDEFHGHHGVRFRSHKL